MRKMLLQLGGGLIRCIFTVHPSARLRDGRLKQSLLSATEESTDKEVLNALRRPGPRRDTPQKAEGNLTMSYCR